MKMSQNNKLKRNKNATLRKTSDRYGGLNKNKNATLRKTRHVVSGKSCFAADGKTDKVDNGNQLFTGIPQTDSFVEVDQSDQPTCTTSMSENDIIPKGKNSNCWDLNGIPQIITENLKPEIYETETCAPEFALDENVTKKRPVKMTREMCDMKNVCSNTNEEKLPNVRYGPRDQTDNGWEGPVNVFYRDDFRSLKYDCFYESPLFRR